jgi:3-methyladenine DNA glycosylase AlkD
MKTSTASAQPSEVDVAQAQAALLALANPEKARFLAGYFKTGKGQYGEGDQFLGIVVPKVRALAKRFRHLPLPDCRKLLVSPYNEARLLALLVLVERYAKGDDATRDAVYALFLKHRHRVNNWNLVDSAAPFITGAHLLQRERSVLYGLLESNSLWDRRIAILSTFAFIRNNDFTETLQLVEKSLNDQQDLMHKACGWMLREVGNRNAAVLEAFLARHHAGMPRTMLRYAIEKFDRDKRKAMLAGSYWETNALPNR